MKTLRKYSEEAQLRWANGIGLPDAVYMTIRQLLYDLNEEDSPREELIYLLRTEEKEVPLDTGK